MAVPAAVQAMKDLLSEEASKGLAAQRAAWLSSELSRAGLSLTVASSVAATETPTPPAFVKTVRSATFDELGHRLVQPGDLRKELLVASSDRTHRDLRRLQGIGKRTRLESCREHHQPLCCGRRQPRPQRSCPRRRCRRAAPRPPAALGREPDDHHAKSSRDRARDGVDNRGDGQPRESERGLDAGQTASNTPGSSARLMVGPPLGRWVHPTAPSGQHRNGWTVVFSGLASSRAQHQFGRASYLHLGYLPPTITSVERRTKEGKTKKEIICWLKRYLSERSTSRSFLTPKTRSILARSYCAKGLLPQNA